MMDDPIKMREMQNDPIKMRENTTDAPQQSTELLLRKLPVAVEVQERKSVLQQMVLFRRYLCVCIRPRCS